MLVLGQRVIPKVCTLTFLSISRNSLCDKFMPGSGKRKVQSKGEITLPQEFREDNDIEENQDYISWKRHSRDKSKLIIEPRKKEEDEEY